MISFYPFLMHSEPLIETIVLLKKVSQSPSAFKIANDLRKKSGVIEKLFHLTKASFGHLPVWRWMARYQHPLIVLSSVVQAKNYFKEASFELCLDCQLIGQLEALKNDDLCLIIVDCSGKDQLTLEKIYSNKMIKKKAPKAYYQKSSFVMDFAKRLTGFALGKPQHLIISSTIDISKKPIDSKNLPYHSFLNSDKSLIKIAEAVKKMTLISFEDALRTAAYLFADEDYVKYLEESEMNCPD